MLKLKGSLKGKQITILVDFGSSHNFVYITLVRQLNLFVYLAMGLVAKVVLKIVTTFGLHNDLIVIMILYILYKERKRKKKKLYFIFGVWVSYSSLSRKYVLCAFSFSRSF